MLEVAWDDERRESGIRSSAKSLSSLRHVEPPLCTSFDQTVAIPHDFQLIFFGTYSVAPAAIRNELFFPVCLFHFFAPDSGRC
jgi:hypothetical protein